MKKTLTCCDGCPMQTDVLNALGWASKNEKDFCPECAKRLIINTFNKWMIGVNGDKIQIMRPQNLMSADDAILMAAWLVSLTACMPATHKFNDVVQAIENC